MANLPQMAGKPVSDRQTAYINGLLASREVSRAQAANAKLWLAAAVESQSGRDIAAILIHELLHKEKRSSYQDSYLS